MGMGLPRTGRSRKGESGERKLLSRKPKSSKLKLLLFVEIAAAVAATVCWLHFDLHAFASLGADRPKTVRIRPPRADDQARAVKTRIRVGDPGSVFDPSKFDERFPDMKEWAKAGVRGGIPFRKDTPVVRKLKPGDDIQAAIDETALAGGGVVLLAPGTYPLDEVIDMRSGVILRGEHKERTVLENHDRTAMRKEREILTVAFPEVRSAGLEDLTLVHAAVKALDSKMYEGKYKNNHNGIDDLHVGHVNIWKSEDCWMDNCRLLYAGTDPIIVDRSKHVTLRDNLVAGSFNKGGGGAGFHLFRACAEYVLCFNERVRGLRHFSLQSGVKYCVVIDCDIETDLNFLGLGPSRNLVENCRVRPPKGHPWEPIAHGYAKFPPPGPGNILYRIDASRGDEGFLCKGVPCDPEGVFSIRTTWQRSMAYRLDVAPPRAGTFYAVTGERKHGGDSPPCQQGRGRSVF